MLPHCCVSAACSTSPLLLLAVCYVRGRAVALSRCCQRSLRKVFSDFVLGLFAGTHTKLACHSDLYGKNLQLAARSLLLLLHALRPLARLEFIRHTSADIV